MPRGLHKRIEAQERRVAELEASIAALQSEYAVATPPLNEGGEELGLAERLATTQVAYDEALLELRWLRSMARRLRDWGLAPADTASWANVCRAIGLPSASGAHRAVRNGEPVLHVLLHRCAMPSHCSLDGVSYSA